MRMKRIVAVCVSLLIVIVASCGKNNPMAPKSGAETGEILLALDMTDAIASGQVEISKGSQTAALPITIANHTGTVTFSNIQVGQWNVAVHLYDSDGTEIYSGSGEAVINKNQTTTLHVRVNANTGNLEISVDFTGTEAIIFRHGIGAGLWTINPDGSDPKMLIPEDTDLCASEANSYRGGNIIVFVGHHPTGGHHCGIYICNRDGSGTHRLDLPPLRHPRFSWNGNKLAANTLVNSDDKLGSIATFNPDGSEYTVLAQGWTPVWTPDGRILFAQGNAIKIMNADGSNQHTIADGINLLSIADCAPNQTIVFNMISASYPGIGLIQSMSIDGSNLQTLTGSTASSDWGRFNTDGSKIVFDRYKDIYTMNSDGSNQICVFDSSSQDEGSSFVY